MEKELKELAIDDDRIIFTGFVQGRILEELYSNAYIYCLPSDLEGMPLSLLEAMSYGNCCLVSDIEECASVVEDKAITFKKSNVEDLKRNYKMLANILKK
ncbi:MAG: glycosyltransferase [Holdemanella porci]